MGLMRAIATVGGYTMASRVLGFARDILIAAHLGAGPVADAFFVAFKLPNFFRRLFAEGAFNAAFVPMFAGLLATEGREAARRFAEEVFALFVAALLLFVTAAQIAMPWAMYVLAPGFAADPAKFALAVELTRITFPYLLFISLVSHLGGVLNSLGRFAAAAAAPILLNVVLILALVAATPLLASGGHALAWGVAAAGIIQFLFLIAACRRAGLVFRLPRPRLTPRMRRFLALWAPGVAGAGVVQINLVVGVIIASFLPTGAISYLYYADRVNQLPLGVVGIAIGTALLPLLVRNLRSGDTAGAQWSFNRAIEFALFLALPAAAALIAIAHPIIVVLFERGAFGPADSGATAAALAAYAAGLPAFVLVKVLAPGFFAREDTVTPVKVAAGCVALNIALCLALVGPLAHVGLALATSIAGWVNVVLLARILRRRGFLVLDARFRDRAPRIAAATAGMTLALVAGGWGAEALVPPEAAARVAALALLVGGGMAVYAVLILALGAARPAELRGYLQRNA